MIERRHDFSCVRHAQSAWNADNEVRPNGHKRWKRSLILGILVVLACVQASTRANAQGDDLFNAAKNGDLPRVKSLLAKGADVNAKQASDGATALIMASQEGHLDVVQVLLDKGADVDAKANDGVPALLAASAYGHLNVVQALLAKGADVNAKRTNDGATALILASQQGQLEVVQALLAKGADVNAKATNGSTALIQASFAGHLDVVQALLAKGADVNAKASNCQFGNYLRIWAGSRELNANRRALFANEKRGSVMIFEWLRPSMRLRTSPTTTFLANRMDSAVLRGIQ